MSTEDKAQLRLGEKSLDPQVLPDCGARWKVEGSWSYFNLSSGGHKLLNQILWQSIQ